MADPSPLGAPSRRQEDRLRFVVTLAEAQRELQAQNSLKPDTLHFAIDLASVATERGLVQSVETVLAAKPWLTTILVSGGSAVEVKAVFALRAIPHLHMLSLEELSDPATWKKVFRDTFVDRQAEEIEKDLCRAEFVARDGCCPEPDLVFAQPALLELCHTNSPRPIPRAPAATFGDLASILRDSLRDFGHSDEFSRAPHDFGCVR